MVVNVNMLIKMIYINIDKQEVIKFKFI